MMTVVSQLSDGFVIARGSLADLDSYDPAVYLVESVDLSAFPDPFGLYWRWSDGTYHETSEV